MKWAVISFPGSNCDMDCINAVKLMGEPVDNIWHLETELKGYDAIILPGGFSYGDYLRAGAISRFSPIMPAVIEHANSGRLVIGICNGFQVLLESGLLVGAMLKNQQLRFRCHQVYLKVISNNSPFTHEAGELLRMPIAHGEGNYFIDPDGLAELEDNDQILFKYADENGNVSPEFNPNGSVANIAGIINKERNVLGMMPHPERAVEKILDSEDGMQIFNSMLKKM